MLADPVTSKGKRALHDWTAYSGSNRHVTNSRVRMKNYEPFDDNKLGTAGSGQSTYVLHMDDLEEAFMAPIWLKLLVRSARLLCTSKMFYMQLKKQLTLTPMGKGA